MRSFAAAGAALSIASRAAAQSALSVNCVTDGVCYSLNIPDATATSGNGDIYFQMQAPTSYEWVALGQGSSMSGSNIFVMYTSSDGSNVTVSPRLGVGHIMPQHDTATKIELLEGSGVSSGMMTANVKCSNCQEWSGGSMDFSASSASWIYAVKSGSALNSDSMTEYISRHDSASSFTWSFGKAKGGDGENPFAAAGGSSGGSAGFIPATCTPIAGAAQASATASRTITAAASTGTGLGPDGKGCPTSIPSPLPSVTPDWVYQCYGDFSTYNTAYTQYGPPQLIKKRDDGCPAGYASTGGSSSADFSSESSGFASPSQERTMLLAHGVLACIAFVALFPMGGILIRVANFPGLLWVHAGLQMFAYFIYIVAFALGVYMATKLDYMTKTHPIIGIVLFVALLSQPLFGWLHHAAYAKVGRRTLWSYLHLYQGRIAILVGMVNGGLGMQLTGTVSTAAMAAYAVIAAIVAIIYLGAIIMGELRRKRKNAQRTPYDNMQPGHKFQDLSSSENVTPFSQGTPQSQRSNEEFYQPRYDNPNEKFSGMR